MSFGASNSGLVNIFSFRVSIALLGYNIFPYCACIEEIGLEQEEPKVNSGTFCVGGKSDL